MKKLLTTAVLAVFASIGHATPTSTTTGGVTTLAEAFNGGAKQCAAWSLTNAGCVAATVRSPDGYLQIAPGLTNSASASFTYDYGLAPANIEVSFYYSTAFNKPGVFEFAGSSLVLTGTGYDKINPGENNSSLEQAYFTHTFNNVPAGSHTLMLSTGNGSLRGLNVDDLKITITPVPEPETYAMMLAGMGLIGSVIRRRAKKA